MNPKDSDPPWTTPGPWRVNKYGSIGAGEFGTTPIVGSAEGLWGSDAEKYGDHCANARLMAAAPEMCAELARLRDLCSRLLEGDTCEAVVSDIDAVLAKARGVRQ